MALQRVSGGRVDPKLYEETMGWVWDMPLYIGGLWPVYWAEDSGEVKRHYFLGKRKLMAHLAKRRLLTDNFRIIDRQGILK